MRFRLGIIAPMVLQVGIFFLYSSIKYQELRLSLLSFIVVLVFPILIIYVIAPQLILRVTRLESRLYEDVEKQLDRFLKSESNFGESGQRTVLLDKRLPQSENIMIFSNQIKNKLVPSIVDRAINYYQDTYFSREDKINQEKSLRYFEGLVLFSLLTTIFLLMDTIIVSLLWFTPVNIFIIEFDPIENPWVLTGLLSIFILSIIATVVLMQYGISKFYEFIPYVTPILFKEPDEEKFYRRETIRSLASYNLDNLIDRRDQREIKEITENTLEGLLKPLLRDEILITARSEFALKLAWNEYSQLLENEEYEAERESIQLLDQLVRGKQIGTIKLEEKDLLGLHADLEYVHYQLKSWDQVDQEIRVFVYFQLYRVVEYIVKEISLEVENIENDEEFNLYSAINTLHSMDFLSEKGKDILHTLRFQRNKLMHEPGVSLDVSKSNIQDVLLQLNKILENIKSNLEEGS